MVSDIPKTLLEAVRYFSDLSVCNKYMREIKWPNGNPTCPKCGGDQIGEIASRHLLRCKAKGCRKQFSFKVDTIFEDSPLGLDKWFVAIWCIANAKNGISSHELGRAIGVTQKSAWFMLHRIREAMRTNDFRKLEGEVESDETFVGGKADNMGAVSKAIVHGLLERGGEARCHVVKDTEAGTLQVAVRRNVKPGSSVYTDAHASYTGLEFGYIHKTIDHLTRYVAGRVHVNGLENFWCLLKRAIKGTYVQVMPFHLERYVDEQEFRFNSRKGTDATRFLKALANVVHRRLTYRVLTAQGDAGFMGIA